MLITEKLVNTVGSVGPWFMNHPLQLRIVCMTKYNIIIHIKYYVVRDVYLFVVYITHTNIKQYILYTSEK